MFFLLKCVFWLGLVFVLLPPDGGTRSSNASRIAQEAARDLETAAAGAAALGLRRARDACLDAPATCLEATRAGPVPAPALPPRRPSTELDARALRRTLPP